MTFKSILIGGGTGFIGSALRSALTKEGFKISVVSRMPALDAISWEDLRSKGIPDGTVAVINVCGQNVFDPFRRWTPGFRQNVTSSRVLTNRMLKEAIQKCTSDPPRVFVTISGVGYYKPDDERVYDESSPGGDFDFLSRLCTDWEKASQLGSIRNVVIRTGLVLGRDGGIIKEMSLPFRLGFGAKIASGNQVMPWIHIEDLCGIFSKAIANENFTGVVNAVAPQIVTNRDFTKTLAKVMWRPAFLTLPESVIEAVFGPDRAVMMTKGQKVISKRLDELGYQFKFTDIEAALTNIVNKK